MNLEATALSNPKLAGPTLPFMGDETCRLLADGFPAPRIGQSAGEAGAVQFKV